MPAPAPIVHFEIGCQNIEAAKSFYSKVFGWEYLPGAPNMGMVGNLGPMASKPTTGIGGHLNSLGHPPHNYVTVYAQVNDLAATLKQVEASGGKTLIPPTEVPNMGHFAWFTDPEGNALGLWKPLSL